VACFTLYYREGCHLCDDMALSLRELLAATAHRVEHVDIDRDEALRQRYTSDVPVLCCGEEVICRHFLDAERLAQFLGENH
jgi:thiol-disulfide isomerase/thioredoxin